MAGEERAGRPGARRGPDGPPAVSLTAAEALAWATRELRRSGVDSPRHNAEVLLQRVLGVDKARLYAHGERMLSAAEWGRFRNWTERRGSREPLQYITGAVEFFGLELNAAPAVLIPRPETEGLVERVLGWRTRWEAPLIVDVGTGSGAIAVALAVHWPRARVVGIDLSGSALRVAERNVRRHGLEGRVDLIRGDLLAPLTAKHAEVDIIVANPPYVPSAEVAGLQPEVSRFEPRLALDGGEDGLAIYRRLFAQLPQVLSRPGAVAVEVGAGQAVQVRSLLEAALAAGRAGGTLGTGVDPDLAGHDRVVWAVVEQGRD